MCDDEKVYRGQSALYVDVQCARCGKRMAMSNAVVVERVFYCPSCAEVGRGVVTAAGDSLHRIKNAMAEDIFGITVDEAHEKGICIECREPADPNCYSVAGKAEWKISGLCERCFDAMYDPEYEED